MSHTPVFFCIKCGHYKPKASKCKSYSCCQSCKNAVIAADNADKTKEKVKKIVASHALLVRNKLEMKFYAREMGDLIFGDALFD